MWLEIKSKLNSVKINKSTLKRILIAILGLIVIGYLLFPPWAPLSKARLVGYSICHQIPERSFHLAGKQLPLCARCTGTYLGILTGFLALFLMRRWYVGEMLSPPMIILVVSFILIMGVDGLNSYIALLGYKPPLYTPQNWLRAATGSLNGIALSMIVWPVFNSTLWKTTEPEPPLKNVWELLGIVLVAQGLVYVVQLEPGWLLYPLALISAGMVLGMLSLVNAMIVLILFHQECRAETWRDAILPLLSGLGLSLLELTAMGVFRYAMTGTLEWPL